MDLLYRAVIQSVKPNHGARAYSLIPAMVCVNVLLLDAPRDWSQVFSIISFLISQA